MRECRKHRNFDLSFHAGHTVLRNCGHGEESQYTTKRGPHQCVVMTKNRCRMTGDIDHSAASAHFAS